MASGSFNLSELMKSEDDPENVPDTEPTVKHFKLDNTQLNVASGSVSSSEYFQLTKSEDEDDPGNIMDTELTVKHVKKNKTLLNYFQTTTSVIEDQPGNVSNTKITVQLEDNKRIIYNYFKKVRDDESECNKCKKTLKTPSSTTTTMKRHLSSQHSLLYKDYLEKLKTKQLTNKTANTKTKNESDIHQQSIQKSMTKNAKFPDNSDKAKVITKKLVEMIALDYQPFSIVEDRGFKNFVAELENRYTLPSRKSLSQKLVPEMYEIKKIQLKTEIQVDMNYVKSVSFTFDMWSSLAQQSYISLTCHYLTNQFELKNKTLACSYFPGVHTGLTILNKIKEMISDWDISVGNEKIPTYFVTDNARNISSAFTINQDTNFTHLLCTAHTLQLTIDDAIKDSNMDSILKLCRLIVTHYNHSNISSERLRKTQKRLNLPQHKLIQMVDTRWNSVFLMLERILEQKDALSIDIVNIKKSNFSSQDWQMIEGYVTILKPVLQASKELSREDTPTLSMVLPIIYTIEAKLNMFITSSNENCGRVLANNMVKAMTKRFKSYKTEIIYLVSMMIDPRFKGLLLNESELNQATLYLQTEAEKYSKQNTCIQSNNQTPVSIPTKKKTSSLWDILQQRSTSKDVNDSIDTSFSDVKKEIDVYLKVPTIEPSEDPLKWWNENNKHYPLLVPVALKFLGIPGTSVCSERLFSHSGTVVSLRRTRLLPSLVEKLVFLHDNI